jgi:hypothetical protein
MNNRASRRPNNPNSETNNLSLVLFLNVESISAIKYQARALSGEILTFQKYHGKGACYKTKAIRGYFTGGIPYYSHEEQVTNESY